MERLKYFELAQRVSVYTNKFRDLSKPVLEDCVVVYRDVEYYPQFIQVGYDENGKVENIAILHDLKTNCQMSARLEKIARLKNENCNLAFLCELDKQAEK